MSKNYSLVVFVFGILFLQQVYMACTTISTDEIYKCFDDTNIWHNLLPARDTVFIKPLMSSILEQDPHNFCHLPEALNYYFGYNVLNRCFNINQTINDHFFGNSAQASMMAYAQLDYICNPNYTWALEHKEYVLRALFECKIDPEIYNSSLTYINCVRTNTEIHFNNHSGCFAEKFAGFSCWYDNYNYFGRFQLNYTTIAHLEIKNRCHEDATCVGQKCTEIEAKSGQQTNYKTASFITVFAFAYFFDNIF